MKKRFVLIFLSFIIFTSWFLLSNPANVFNIIIKASPIFILMAIAAMLTSLLTKSYRWKIFLSDIKINIPFSIAFSTFVSGLFVTLLTPARAAEPIRCILLKEKTGSSFSRTLPLVVVERIIDLFTLLIFSVFLLFTMSFMLPEEIGLFLNLSAAITIIILIITIFMIINKKFGKFILKFVLKIPKIRKFEKTLKRSLDNFYHSSKCIRVKTIFIVVFMTLIAWTAEGVVLYLAIKSVGLNIPIFIAVEIVALSTIIGLISSLPGGLGSTEAVMTLLLVPYLLTVPISTTATLIYRFSSLWVFMFIGLIVITKSFGLEYIKKQVA